MNRTPLSQKDLSELQMAVQRYGVKGTAAQIGVNPKTLYNWLHHRTSPSNQSYAKILAFETKQAQKFAAPVYEHFIVSFINRPRDRTRRIYSYIEISFCCLKGKIAYKDIRSAVNSVNISQKKYYVLDDFISVNSMETTHREYCNVIVNDTRDLQELIRAGLEQKRAWFKERK